MERKKVLKQIISNKKGLSEMIAYVILIVIAVSLSILVFTYLKGFVPKFEKPECPEGTSLTILSADCTISAANATLLLTFLNQGRFNISAVYLKIGPENRQVKLLINEDDLYFQKDLLPGDNISRIYSGGSISSKGDYILEVEPATITKKGLALCEKSVISEPITCV